MMERINARVFITVSRLRSYRKAADELGYSQAGISYIINSMEEEAGFRFFVREFGGVRLTREGEQILPIMEKLFEMEQHVNDQVDRIRGLETGHIRLLSFNSVIVCWLPDILAGFKEKYPGIKIELSACDNPKEAIRRVSENEADCCFVAAKESDSIELFLLAEEPDVAVVAKDHPMAKKKIFPVTKMAEYPFIGSDENEMKDVYDMASRQGVSLDQIMTVNSDYGCFSLISKNLGFGIYPEMVVEKCGFPVKAIPIDHPSITPISLGVRSYENCSLATKAFVDFVRSSEL